MKTAIAILSVGFFFLGCSGKKQGDQNADSGAGDADSDTDSGVDAGNDASTGCVSDEACDDGNACTSDRCDPDSRVCGSTASNESGACGAAGICARGTCYDPWPPTDPWHTGSICALPACDESAVLPFDFSGNWTVTTKTTSTTCNLLVQSADPRLAVGAVHTGNPHPLHFVGGCDYPPDASAPPIGTFVSNVEVTCEVNSRPDSTKTVETSVVTFGDGGTASGKATVTLINLPLIALQTGRQCKVEMDVSLERVPNCAGASDCNDDLDCTTDSCDVDSGVCQHALAASHCLIDNSCIDDGALQSATGDGSCRKCVATAPSQYGWIVLGSGESCDDGDAGTSNDACQTGGLCQGD